MAPKKSKQKMSLNEFLGDSALGSWADEMDSLPSAPAAREDDGRAGDRRGRDDFLSSRPDRGFGPPREDLPMPTQPPFTAFVGNLAFDLTDADLSDFFAPSKIKSVKIIKDRDERPKGFGYVEFEDLDGLKNAMERTGSNIAGRAVRVSVAEPPKERERGGFGGAGGGGFDDEKFANPWRRDGPLPDLPGAGSRDASRRPSRFDSERGERPDRGPPPPSVSENVSDWRAMSRPSPRAAPAELPRDRDQEGGERAPGFRRQGSGLRNEGPAGPADTEETWSKGSRFKPAEESQGPGGGRFGGPKRDMGPPPPREPEGEWRSARPRIASHESVSPSDSTPPTPQMGRRRLELLPRSTSGSASPSPLSSPRLSNAPAVSVPRSNPFGDARPVDVTGRETAIAERLEKERESLKDRAPPGHSMSRTQSQTQMTRTQSGHGMSRTSSRPGADRPSRGGTANASTPPTPTSARFNAGAANIRPAISFANAAGRNKDKTDEGDANANSSGPGDGENQTDELAEKVAEIEVS